MLLAIDIGNTNTVFAVCEGDNVVQSWRLRTDVGRSCDEYAAFLQQLFSLLDLHFDNVTGVIVSSVVPEANFHIRGFCKKYTGQTPVFVDVDMIGIGVHQDRPEDVGADRLVNAVAVKHCHSVPAVVIDFGTATNFDVVDENGNHIGGVLAPGINLSIAALHQASSKLPKISDKKPDNVIGKSTVSAMQSGIYYGYLSLIEGMIARIKEELGGEPLILATGGLAPLFAKDTNIINAVDQDLTIRGLIKIYKDTKAQC